MLSIIVPVYNEFHYTKQLLDELHKVETPFQLIIIDNWSTDETKDYFVNAMPTYDKQIGFIYKRHEENTYVNPAWNEWVKLATEKYIMIINNDLLLEQWFEKPLIEALHDNIMISSPIYTIWDKQNDVRYQHNRFNPNNLCWHCYCMRKEHRPKIPESIKIWFGDNYIFETMKQRGMIQVACPNSRIHHFESKTVKRPEVQAIIEQDKAEWFVRISDQFRQSSIKC